MGPLKTKRSQLNDAVDAWWAGLAVEEDPRGRERGRTTLLVETGADEGWGGGGRGGVKQLQQLEDPLVTLPEGTTN